MNLLNLAYFLTRAARLHPDRPAIVHGERMLSYRSLDERVGCLAGALVGLGLQRGDRVGIVVEIEPRAIECLLAPLRAGFVLVPMNPRLHASEYAFMLRKCGAKVLLVSNERLDDLLSIRTEFSEVKHIVGIDAPSVDGVLDYESLLADAMAIPDVEVSEQDLAWIFFTSGTTGRPKGAMHTHRSLRTMVETQLIESLPVQRGDRLAVLTPMSHAAGLMVFHEVAGAGTHVFPAFRGFHAEDFYQLVESQRITKCMLVPTMIQRLLDAPWPVQRDLSSLRTVMYGAAPMYVERLKEAIDRFGPIFVGVFAQGEAPLACTWLPKEEHAVSDEGGLKRLASVGRESYGVQVRVVGENDEILPPNSTGEIVVRGDLVMQGYWDDAEATDDTLRNGWLHTGDVGHMDEDHYLYITDRLKDMIIKGGTNIYPREIEEVLYRHADVQEATVFGVPDPEWGEAIIAAVSLRRGATVTEGELGAWCAAHISAFKKPSKFHFVDELAKNGYGKIMKREVRKALYPEIARSIGG
ncbi:MAG: AMP-binding protein [Burkholderiaceae bacterium]|nr:AMP-binding protein [Burkholderiaceae bacterium]